MAMQLKPLSDHVLIEPLKEETRGGIIIPDTAGEKPMRGRIAAVGPGKRNEKGELQPMSVQVGDVVLFRKYGPDEIKVSDKEYLIGREDDILAVIEIK